MADFFTAKDAEKRRELAKGIMCNGWRIADNG